MIKSTLKEVRRESIAVLVGVAIDRGKEDLSRAVKELIKILQEDETVWEEVQQEAVEMWCWEKVRGWAQSNRKLAWLPPNYDKGGKGERVIRLAEGNVESLLSGFRLPIHSLPELGSANRSMVKEAVAFYREHSVDMMGKARWLDLIAQKLTGNKVVRDVFSEEELRRLQAKVLKSIVAE